MTPTSLEPHGRAQPAPCDRRTQRAMQMALAWSVLTALAALAWATGILPHPFADQDSVLLGAMLNAAGPVVGTAFTLALGLVGLLCAATALRGAASRPTGRATAGLALLLAATPVLVVIHGKLLMLLGYTPVVVAMAWRIPGLWSAYVEAVSDPETIFLLHAAAGTLVWGWAGLLAWRRSTGACEQCGRPHGWTEAHEASVRARALRVGRIAVGVGALSAVGYPAIRLPWLLGLAAGLDADSWAALQAEPGAVAVGVSLGAAGLVGAVLMVGLVAGWGVRFPRWMVGLAGRRVPVPLAVVPAAIVSVGLIGFGRGVLLALVRGDLTTPVGDHLATLGVLLAMLPWGIALAVAAGAYAMRRRGPCGSCARGLPEGALAVRAPTLSSAAVGGRRR